jgi:hypothetical protein
MAPRHPIGGVGLACDTHPSGRAGSAGRRRIVYQRRTGGQRHAATSPRIATPIDPDPLIVDEVSHATDAGRSPNL